MAARARGIRAVQPIGPVRPVRPIGPIRPIGSESLDESTGRVYSADELAASARTAEKFKQRNTSIWINIEGIMASLRKPPRPRRNPLATGRYYYG